jgi:hypothetical protein
MKENTPMKTNDELETLIQNLIERMNRVEATVAKAKSARPDWDEAGAESACQAAISAIDAALEAQAKSNQMLASIASSLRSVW